MSYPEFCTSVSLKFSSSGEIKRENCLKNQVNKICQLSGHDWYEKPQAMQGEASLSSLDG